MHVKYLDTESYFLVAAITVKVKSREITFHTGSTIEQFL